jgi:hypothetical protein
MTTDDRADDREYVTKDWAGLMEIVRDLYPADIFDGSSGDPGPTIVTLLRRVEVLTVERDRAREEAGVQAHFRDYHREEATSHLKRLMLARDALVATGYFTAEQCKGLDIAPRIIEYASAMSDR